MRLSLPRSECAKTTTKYSLFIVSPGRTLFWIRARREARRSGGAISIPKCYWRIPNCNRDDTTVSTHYLSLQVVDILGIVGIERAFKTAWNPFFAEPGGTA